MWAALLLVAAVAAWTDARSGRIPNWLTLPAIAAGCVLGGGWSLFGSIACGVMLPLLAYGRVWVGGGDVKLAAALGALFPLVGGLVVVAVWIRSMTAPRLTWRAGPFAFGFALALFVASRLA